MTRHLILIALLALSPFVCAPLLIQGGGAPCCTSPPTVRALGNLSGSTGTCNPGLPIGTAIGDLLILFIETANETATMSSAGWTEAPSSPQGTGTAGGVAASRTTIFYKISVDAADLRVVNDSGDHNLCKIMGITAGTFNASAIFDTSSGQSQAATTAVSVPGATTTVDNTLIVVHATGAIPDANGSNQFTTIVNTSLSSIVEHWDQTRNTGNGGANGLWTGTMDSAGTYNSSTSTAGTSSERGTISLAVTPI